MVVRGGTLGSVTARTATGVLSVVSEGGGRVPLGVLANEMTTLHKAACNMTTNENDGVNRENQ